MTQIPAPPPQLSPAEERKRKLRRRRNEVLLAILAFFLVLILTSVQVSQLQAGDALFMVVFNINFILLLGILFVVLRNTFKLILERRRKVLGSRLRTRLLVAFVGFSLLPCSLMFLVTTKYVQLSIDFWFKDQIENSMEVALDMARTVYDNAGMRLIAQAKVMHEEVENQGLTLETPAANSVLEAKRKEYLLDLAGYLTPEQREKDWEGRKDILRSWVAAKNTIDWQQCQQTGSLYVLAEGEQTDVLFALLALQDGKNGYLVLAEDMGKGFKSRLDRISMGKGEYKKLRALIRPLKRMLYSSLGVLTAMIILGAVWYAFRMAREISAPVHALASGTAAIAKGDLSIRLTDRSQDELGMLIRSFNQMAEDLEHKQREITGANAMLEQQNMRIARHSKYIETILDNITAGVISFDLEGRVNTVNKAACDMLELSLAELPGTKVDNILPEPYAEIIEDVRERLREHPEHSVAHTLVLRNSGEEKRLIITVAGFATEGILRGAVAVIEDITELERMQRTAAWREVARRIAHEIKNPLTPIKLSAQRLARKFGQQVQDPAFIQSTHLIVQQVEHLQNMVQEFSAFAKLPEVVPKQGPLLPLIENITTLFRNSHSKIDWQVIVSEPLPEIPMDFAALHRAFMNIYTNAVEVLALSKTVSPMVHTHITLDHKLHSVRIDVLDNGPGLTKQERAQLFEPYFSHKKGGTGLGLTIVRSIVSDHRGYVRANPRPQGGTIISIELPLY